MLLQIVIIYKHNSSDAIDLAKNLANWLRNHGRKVLILEAGGVHPKDGYTRTLKLPIDCQLIIVLGGDGTMLEAVREVVDAELQHVPILGVKLGGLGFLTALTPEEVFFSMEKIIAGYFLALPRLMIQARVERMGQTILKITALNDIVINKAALARIVDLSLAIDKQPLTTLRADGLIISTPTGSTAYNLSAGGPICYPSLECMLVTPICSFSLNNRPLLLSPHMTLTVILDYSAQETFLTCDGQVGLSLLAGDRISISRAVETVRLVQSPYKDYFKILRSKLNWG